jgi:hypothetical protein
MVEFYHKTPSELMYIEDEYTAYCLNEAIATIILKLKNNEEPVFSVKYKSFSDMYKNYK